MAIMYHPLPLLLSSPLSPPLPQLTHDLGPWQASVPRPPPWSTTSSTTPQGQPLRARYDGYTSRPLVLGYDSLILAGFKYGFEPKETFGRLLGVDQGRPRWAFYQMKKHLFPWIYWSMFLRGYWYERQAG